MYVLDSSLAPVSVGRQFSTIDVGIHAGVKITQCWLKSPQVAKFQLQGEVHTRPRSVAAGNRHSHATLGIMGNHRKVVLYHNNVDFTATRGQRVKATTV